MGKGGVRLSVETRRDSGYGPRAMGLLDIPRGIVSRLPLIGGSGESDSSREEEPEEPVNEAPDEDRSDEDTDPSPDPDGPGGEAEERSGDAEDISGTTAPSIGPNTVIEKDSPEERLARHDQSDKDAMGLDKRREVIGGSYGAGFGKQLIRWAAVVIVVIAAAFGAKLLVDDLDKAPAHAADKAPWSGTKEAPAPLE